METVFCHWHCVPVQNTNEVFCFNFTSAGFFCEGWDKLYFSKLKNWGDLKKKKEQASGQRILIKKLKLKIQHIYTVLQFFFITYG